MSTGGWEVERGGDGSSTRENWDARYLLFKEVKVEVEQSYHIPISHGLFRLMGFDQGYTITKEASAVIKDPAEFIRNTDLLLEMVD